MTEKEINKAIASACGKGYHKPTEEETAQGSYYQYEPNYYRSLDTIHEAEKLLMDKQRAIYASNLADLLDAHGYRGILTCFATAPQRAEAFLKTIGKWKES